jgi:hypothetical protein
MGLNQGDGGNRAERFQCRDREWEKCLQRFICSLQNTFLQLLTAEFLTYCVCWLGFTLVERGMAARAIVL